VSPEIESWDSEHEGSESFILSDQNALESIKLVPHGKILCKKSIFQFFGGVFPKIEIWNSGHGGSENVILSDCDKFCRSKSSWYDYQLCQFWF
jgi:hypothetical protein